MSDVSALLSLVITLVLAGNTQLTDDGYAAKVGSSRRSWGTPS